MNQKYICNAQCETVQMDEAYMILHPNAFTITKLNTIGGEIWSMLQSGQSTAALIEAIRDKYKVSDSSLEDDIRHFLAELLECDLIEYAAE